MPRYYFNVRQNGELVEDQEGDELASPAEAHKKAIKAAREIISERVLAGKGVDGAEFVVTDEAGQTVTVVKFREAIAPN